jgi:hypothetical protein
VLKKCAILSATRASFFKVISHNFFFAVPLYSVPWDASVSQEKVLGHLDTATIGNLKPYTQYKARVKATNDLGTGNPSNVIAVRISAPISREIWHLLRPISRGRDIKSFSAV